MLKRKILPLSLLILALSSTIFSTSFSVSAISESQKRFYSNNNIIFYDPDGDSSNSSYAGSLKSGGMTYEEAVAWINTYKASESRAAEWGISQIGSCYSAFANCAALPKYFANRYLGLNVGATGNGADVVNVFVSSYGFTYGGTSPRPYAIFSTSSGSMMCGSKKCGHTGLVLGVNEEEGVVYTAEAFCGSPLSSAKVKTYSIATMTSGAYTFAYSDNFLSSETE